ncbi:MAG: hypothetical protein MI743_02840 [Sneathiellales bacterium]|nr:hypothetical protein [Sneathiellales bacterium]
MTKENKSFRNGMYALLLFLLVAYIGYKVWHLSLAIEMLQGQEVEVQYGQPAK